MTWVRLEQEFADHPKVVEAGPLAAWLHVKAISYCNRYLTDGRVPRGTARTLVSWDDAGPLLVPAGQSSESINDQLIARLVTAGMWLVVDGGYRIHDYLKFQPSRAKVLADREAERLRKENWRKKKERVPVNVPAGQTAVSLPGPALSDPDPVSSLPSEEGVPPSATPAEQGEFRLAAAEKPTSSTPKPSAPDVAEAVMHYRRRWVEIFRPRDGQPPTLTKADRGQLVAMLKAHGPDTWRGYLERFLADRDPKLMADGHALAFMPRRLNGYRASPAPATNHPRPAAEVFASYGREEC